MAIINFNSISGVSTISVASSITVGNNVSIGTDRITATTFSGNLNSTSGATTVAAGNTSTPSITPTGDSNTGIFFPSADTIAFAEGGIEALRINSSANIGIGTDNPTSGRGTSGKVLNVTGTGVNSILSVQSIDGVNDRNAILELLSSGNGSSSSEIVFGNTDTTPVTNSPLVFSSYYSGSTLERARISNTGNFQIANGNLEFSTSGKGIDFSATANSSGTMTSELLSDYEEGTWTPVWLSSGTLPTVSYSTQSGYYVRIGRVVHFWGRIFINSWGGGGGSGNIRVGGLPYTSNSDSNHGGPLCQVTFSYSGGNAVWPTGVTQVFARVLNNTTTLEYIGLGAPTTQLGESAPLQWTTNPQMYNNYFNGSYFV